MAWLWPGGSGLLLAWPVGALMVMVSCCWPDGSGLACCWPGGSGLVLKALWCWWPVVFGIAVVAYSCSLMVVAW